MEPPRTRRRCAVFSTHYNKVEVQAETPLMLLATSAVTYAMLNDPRLFCCHEVLPVAIKLDTI
jgi:hypothetical protein